MTEYMEDSQLLFKMASGGGVVVWRRDWGIGEMGQWEVGDSHCTYKIVKK